METQNLTYCEWQPLACNAGIERPAPALESESQASIQKTRKQAADKPWSIFGDVYWI